MSRAIDIAKYEGHTEGPWLVSVGTVQLHVYAKDGIGTICSVGLPEYDKARPVGTKAERANAHLIADAPDLLRQRDELLEAAEVVAGDIEGFLNEDWDGNDEGWQALSNRLRAAIANARREEGKR